MQFKSCYKALKYMLPLFFVGGIAWAQQRKEDRPLKIKLERPLSTARPSGSEVINQVSCKNDPVTPGVPSYLIVNEVNEKTVSLSWNNTEALNGLFEDFESHEDFEVNSSGMIGWKYVDLDQKNTYTLSSAVYPNAGSKMAYIVFNPSMASPALENPNLQAYSGNKYLAAFAVDGKNNDWIISPELSFDEEFTFSFRVRSFTEQYGLERIRVGYSLTGSQPADFTFLTLGEYEEVPAEWILKSFNIPADAKYVTINCVSNDAFILMIDDIFIGTNLVRPREGSAVKLAGFNLYRDGVKLNDALMSETNYQDIVPDYGNYEYSVSAVFSDGSEVMSPAKVTAKVKDTRLLPFYESFDTWSLSTQGWSLPDGSASNWSINYFVTGLMNPSLTYRYSRLYNYSQSAVSRDLYTIDPENTFIRFDVKLVNWGFQQPDSLSVEVADAADNFQNWKNAITIINKEGTFPWETYQCDISDKLNHPNFKFRFRAHGTYAYDICYWHVDNIKVWNPEWSSATILVRNGAEQVSESQVKLTGAHGGCYEGATDLSGTWMIPAIETGRYEISVIKDGYNDYKDSIDVQSSTNEIQIPITAPRIQMEFNQIEKELKQEEIDQTTVKMSNTGNGPVYWKLQPNYAPRSGDESAFFSNAELFNAGGDLQNGVIFDGENYYSSSWYFMGRFFKYDKNGDFLEEFQVDELYYQTQDLTFDGRYVYTSNKTNVIYKIDLKARKVVGEILVKELPSLQIKHISYDTRNGELWIGDYNSICRIDMDGNVKLGLKIISEYSLYISGSAFDNYTPGGPYLWFSCENSEGDNYNSYNLTALRQFRLSTLELTSKLVSLSNLPGFTSGTVMTGPVYASGAFSSTDLRQGELTFIGILQHSPSRIYNFSLCDLSNGITFSPLNGTLNPGESTDIQIRMDALNASLGDQVSSQMDLYTIPQLDQQTLIASYSVTQKADYPRPVNLNADLIDNHTVALQWACGDSENAPTGYRVYRNDELITPENISETSFNDTNLLRGNYKYSVQALYGSNVSQSSDDTEVDIRIGLRCYAPFNTDASVEKNTTVRLSWDSPYALLQEKHRLSWYSFEQTESLGKSTGGLFFVAALWDKDDLQYYENMRIDSIQLQLQEYVNNIHVQVYQDGRNIHSQAIASENLKYGEMMSVPLNKSIYVEPGSDYMIALRIVHEAGFRPLAMDTKPSKYRKGNLFSEDGKNWSLITDQGSVEGNFAIAFTLSPNEDMQNPELLGYNLYRDGEKINSDPVQNTFFEDMPQQEGYYQYAISAVYNEKESYKSGTVSARIFPIGDRLAPQPVEGNVSYNRNINLRWGYSVNTDAPIASLPLPNENAQIGNENPIFIFDRTTHESGESGIASDGTYLYTSSLLAAGKFNKYSLTGDFIESFVISGVDKIRDITFDGTYFYGGANESTLYQLDFTERKLIAKYSVSEIIRHTTYVPQLDNGNGGFETGDWTSSIFITKKGAKIGSGPAFDKAFGTAYHNNRIYAFEQKDYNGVFLCTYDLNSRNKITELDLSDYPLLMSAQSSAAGGLTIFTSEEGIVYLAAIMQASPKNTIALFELERNPVLSGYHIFRNGEQITDVPVTNRYFTDKELPAGNYEYQIQSVYLDDSNSDPSGKLNFTITSQEDCSLHYEAKVYPSTSPYNAIISIADYVAAGSDIRADLENGSPFELFTGSEWNNQDYTRSNTILLDDYTFPNIGKPGAWRYYNPLHTVPEMTNQALAGSQALISMPAVDGQTQHYLISPELNYSDPFIFGFSAANLFDRLGAGSLNVYVSYSGNSVTDFILLQEIKTSEAWDKHRYEIQPSVRYIAIAHEGDGKTPQLIDQIYIRSSVPDNQIYAFDIIRDQVQLNDRPIDGISFTDCNLLPGNYEYQLRMYGENGCILETESPLLFNLNYTLSCEAPANLSLTKIDSDIRLDWSAPALCDQIYLKWHSGKNVDAIGVSDGGAYYAGVEWTEDDLVNYQSLSVSDIEFYIQYPPDALFVLIYENNRLVYQQYVPSVRQFAFNTVSLKTPYKVPSGKKMRIALYAEHNSISYPLGFDEGPEVNGKGNLYSADGISWTTLQDKGIYGNWNISVGLKAYPDLNRTETQVDPIERIPLAENKTDVVKVTQNPIYRNSTMNRFNGFNVYKNGEKLNENPLFGTTFTDEDIEEGILTYHVSAIYQPCGEVYSDPVTMSLLGTSGLQDDAIRTNVKDNVLYLNGLRTDDRVEITSSNGVLILHERALNEKASFEISGWEKGIYILKVTRQSETILITKFLR